MDITMGVRYLLEFEIYIVDLLQKATKTDVESWISGKWC